MKIILPLLLAAAGLTACVHIKPTDNPSGVDYVASGGSRLRESRSDLKQLDIPEVAQRAKNYEKRGYTRDEARALAQTEYLKSGR